MSDFLLLNSSTNVTTYIHTYKPSCIDFDLNFITLALT